ncbi:unnamed protein product [Adineta steineri]|uniref:Uncharacterized protein n=1 Tax=Adineta steineri TaxID=433720 RepID=A0A818YZS2_9BILA|nr:unnamed protein product [Adineta steineri]
MFVLSRLKGCIHLWIFIAFFAISNAQSNLTALTSIKSCPSSQSLCGETICYDPAIQNCTELDKNVQCIGICGNQCYNPNTHKCFNGTLCERSEQLCTIKYYSGSPVTNDPPLYQCYNPTTSVSTESNSIMRRCML